MNTIKVLISGEGKHDIGSVDHVTQEWVEGPAVKLLSKACPKNVIFELSYITRDELSEFPIGVHPGHKGTGLEALKLARIALKKRIFHCILFRDCDSVKKVDFATKRKAIIDGFNDASKIDNIKGIPMMPMRILESWLLSDKKAFAQFKKKKTINPPLPQHPESLNGTPHDPTSDYPKYVLKRVLESYSEDDSFENKTAIAEKTDIQEIVNKCPISFGGFLEDIKNLL